MITAHYEAVVAGIAVLLWTIIIGLLHFFKPHLRPATHTVSEYAREPKGWIMQIAFFSMACGCFSLTLAAWPFLHHLGLVFLAINGVCFTAAGVFVTDPLFVTKEDTTLSGTLHNVFSFVVILLFPVMAMLVSINAVVNSQWSFIHSLLPVLVGLTWLGSAFFILSLVRFVGESEKQPTHIPIGYFQRFMISSFSVWLIVISLVMALR